MSALAAGLGLLVSAGVQPNKGPTLEDLVFDPTLYVLASFTVVLALLVAWSCLRTASGPRWPAAGIGLWALGFALAISSAILLLALFRAGVVRGSFYLQAEFSGAYIASALILLGLDGMVLRDGGSASPTRSRRVLRPAVWVAFAACVVYASAILLNPQAQVVTSNAAGQHVAQQEVFYLPTFYSLLVSVLGVVFRAYGSRARGTRRQETLLSLFLVAVIAGLLRESTIIPSLGDPLADMLAAFAPFAIGSVFLYASAKTRIPGSSSYSFPKARNALPR
ncbi:MAG TPA: hypothetical protein VLX56_06445 [Nitrososphaerales archaeon]|nr:hypothetical protein [Nitrososphaerales archaeon]